MDQEIDKLIWEYIDGSCSVSDEENIKRLLTDNPLWKERYIQMMEIHALLQKEELEMPSLRFSKNVLEEIARYNVAPATKNYINKNVIHGIAAFFLLMIIGLLIYFIGQIQWVSYSSNNLIPSYSQDAIKFNWSKFFNNSYVNIFIGINVILGLLFIDKYMLEKKKSRQTGH